MVFKSKRDDFEALSLVRLDCRGECVGRICPEGSGGAKVCEGG